MHCFAYGGSGDPCSLNNHNDENDGIYKDPSRCSHDTFYLWDEPDTQGHDYSWAGSTWLDYSRRFAEELRELRSRGVRVTGPLVRAGDRGDILKKMHQFFNACGSACFDPADPAYVNVVAINGFCGPWNKGSDGCRDGAKWLLQEAQDNSRAFNDIPVYITNWSRLRTVDPSEQLDAINCIDAFFPPSSVVQRVYWFGPKYG